MSRWFRFHADAMRNPKVGRLSDKEFRLWVELLSVAAENDGLIPCLSDLKHVLKRRLDHLSTGVERLISMGLIDALGGGYEPHNWSKFQYKSDVSTDRVKRHREKRNVSETPPDTDTDTDTEIVIAKAIPIARAKREKTSAHAIPDGWVPMLTGKSQAVVDAWPPGMLEAELDKFRDHAADKGRTSKDWQAAFRTWIKNADNWKPSNDQSRPAYGKPYASPKVSGDGAIRALDRQLGLGEPAGSAGRRDAAPGAGHSQLALTARTGL